MKATNPGQSILAGTSTTIGPSPQAVNYTPPLVGIGAPVDPSQPTEQPANQAPLTGEGANVTSTDLAPAAGITTAGAIASQSTPKHIAQASNSKPKG